jgi:hypothetical protein
MMARRKVYAGEVGEGAGRSQRWVQAIERVVSTLQIFPTVGTLAILAAALDLTPSPMPAREPMRLTESAPNELDLVARGIAKAISAACGLEQPGSWKSSHESVSWPRL